jgi:cytochrome c oxidase assembly protein subunit 15
MGTVVGFLSILLTIAAWKWEARRGVRWLATAVLGMVIFQGVLGGLRVVLVKLDLAIVHACVAQAFFCLATLVAVITSKWWLRTTLAPESEIHNGRRLLKVALLTVAIIYMQLVIGAIMRHENAGLAVQDFPLIYGHLLPPMSQQAVHKINAHRLSVDVIVPGYQYNRIVTLGQIWLHSLHRYGAVCVSIAVLVLVAMAARHRALRWLSITLLVLLVVQLTLGSLVVILRKPADLTSAHVAVGALTLMTAFVIAIRTWRLYVPRHRPRASEILNSVPRGARVAMD